MSISARKRHGVVYTPPSIVALILDNALPSDAGGLAAASVCDPACGVGGADNIVPGKPTIPKERPQW